MCGALATREPSASNTAHEKSSRSFIFTECAVFASVTPICSATDIKILLKISSITGSGRVLTTALLVGSSRSNRRLRRASTRAFQPASTTVVALASEIKAGPVSFWPGCNRSRSKTGCVVASAPAPKRHTSGLYRRFERRIEIGICFRVGLACADSFD